MKAATIKEIKTELAELAPDKLLELCLDLAKYKKENKELLTYLLFEAHDENLYIKDIKSETEELFKEINKSNSYLAKKSIRKILRITNKHIKYSGNKQTEVELLIFFCKSVKKTGVPLYANTALGNLYIRQVQKIKKSLQSLHEDLQFDYLEEVNRL
jgi:hypothetical protein